MRKIRRHLIGLALLLASCAPRQTLPPATPPPAPPPAPAEPAGEQRVWRPSASRVQVPDPSFAVAMVRETDGKREPAAEAAARAVTLLTHNGLAAWTAQSLADLPAAIDEAAKKAAAAHAASGGKGDVYILGEVRPGGATQVRMAAVDLRQAKVIDTSGFQGPSSDLDGIVLQAMQDLLGRVRAYWQDPSRARPAPRREEGSTKSP